MQSVVDHRPVVVGVDGSEPALQAVRWGAAEAARRGLLLRLVAAVGEPQTGHVGDAGPGPGYLRGVLTEAARGQLSVAGALARETAAEVATADQIQHGAALPVLVGESSSAAMVVVGARGSGGFQELRAGSVAVGLAAHAGCPVVVVRGGPIALAAARAAPVVVGVDGSPNSAPAVAFAFEEAALRGVPLVAAHTWIDQPLGNAAAVPVEWEAVETGERRVLTEQLAGWAEKFPDVEVRRVINRDRPANTLVELSTGAQLVVVGSRGRGGLAGMLLGSVGRVLIHHARCPVAVVR